VPQSLADDNWTHSLDSHVTTESAPQVVDAQVRQLGSFANSSSGAAH